MRVWPCYVAMAAIGGTVGLGQFIAPVVSQEDTGPVAQAPAAPVVVSVVPYEVTRVRSIVSDINGGQKVTVDVKNNSGQDIFLSDIDIKFSTQSRGYLHAGTHYDTVDAGTTQTVTVRFTSDSNFLIDRVDLYSAEIDGMVTGYTDDVRAAVTKDDLALTLQDCYLMKRAKPEICDTIRDNQRGYDPSNLDPFHAEDFTRHLGEPIGGNDDLESAVEDAAQSAVMHELG